MWDDLLDKVVPVSYTNLGYKLRRGSWSTQVPSMQGRVCVITGANAGLGFATAQALAKAGATLHLLCRNQGRGQDAQRKLQALTAVPVSLHVVDMSLQQSVRRFASEFVVQGRCVDVLINNAGVLLESRQVTAEGFEVTFATNTLGVMLLTELLRPALLRARHARVINLTSGGMYTAKLPLRDPQYKARSFDGVKAYAETKRTEVVMTRHWAQDPAWEGVFFASVHPGWADTKGVQTSLPRFWKLTRAVLRSPEQGADTVVWLSSMRTAPTQANGALWFDRRVRPEHQMSRTKDSVEDEVSFLNSCRAQVGL